MVVVVVVMEVMVMVMADTVDSGGSTCRRNGDVLEQNHAEQ